MRTYKGKRGVALILAIGVLAILAILALAFTSSMLLQQREALNFLNTTKAQYIAEAGINRALVDIRLQVTTADYNSLKNYADTYDTNFGTAVSFGSEKYTLDIQSEETKVNINTFDENDSTQIAILYDSGSGIPYQQIANIIDYRDDDGNTTTVGAYTGIENGTCKNAPYNSTEETKAAFVNAGATVTQANTWYNQIKDYITISKPIMRGGLLGKYYSNITGSSPNIQIDTSAFRGEIVELGHFEEHYIEGGDGDVWDQDSGWTESHDAEFAGGYLIASIPGEFGEETFAVIWNGYIEILSSEVGSPITFWVLIDDGARIFIDGQNILPASAWQDQEANLPGYSGTYTFNSPGWHRIRIEYYDNAAGNTIRIRWKGADFSSSTVIPAERFGYEAPTESGTYNHAGNYKITSTSQIIKGTLVAAEEKLSSTMKIFGTWTQTTAPEFYAAWFNDYAAGIPSGYTNADGNLPGSGGDDYRDGEMRNVTWLDTCPLDATANLEAGGYSTQSNSLKLGFWLDVDTDPTYTACFLRSLMRLECWGTNNWTYVTKDDGAHNFFYVSWPDFRDGWTADSDFEVTIDTSWHESRRFEVNPFYYFPSDPGNVDATADGTPDVFMRCWTAIDANPCTETRSYWKACGTLIPDGAWFTDGGRGEPTGFPAGTVGGIPADAMGNEADDDTPYAATGTYGWAYDWLATKGKAPDGKYQKGERICKVHTKTQSEWKGIYNATLYNINNQGVNYDYWQPEFPATTPRIYGAGERHNQQSRGFSVLTKNNDGGFSYSENDDNIELTLDNETDLGPAYNTRITNRNFSNPSVLSVVGKDGNYTGFSSDTSSPPNFTATPTVAPLSAVSVPNFQFLSCNTYDASLNLDGTWNERAKWWTGNVQKGSDELKRTGGNRDTDLNDPSNNISLTIYWDNIRIIPASGFLVSTPFYCGETAQWGTVSWTENKPTNTNVNIYLRTAGPSYTDVPSTDTFSTSYSSGDSISATNAWIQYKAVLSSTAFQTGVSYSSSGGVTPRLDDITMTYIPTVEVLSWKEGF